MTATEAKAIADDVQAVMQQPGYAGSALLASLTTAVQVLAEAVLALEEEVRHDRR